MPAPKEDRLFTPIEVSKRYGLAVQTLNNMRHSRRGPRFVKLPNHLVRYRLNDLLEWERESFRECDFGAKVAA